MATRHTNRMTAKVWTPRITSTMDGTPDGVIPLAFWALKTPERRATCIAALQAIDTEMTALEVARAAATIPG